MKKILILMCALIIVVCSMLIVTSCQKEDWGVGDGDPSLLEYRLSDDKTYYKVTGIGDYVGEHLVIPEEYCGQPVKEIGSEVFSGYYHFVGPVWTLELAAPWLKALTIPNSVTKIAEGSFTNSNIERIYIGSGVSDIQEHAFSATEKLTEINVSKDNQSYMSKDGVLYSKNGTKLIKYPENKDKETFRIPNKVVVIAEYAFAGANNLIKVKMRNKVTNIGKFAFNRARIEEIKMPDSVESLGASAFEGCSLLKKVNLSKGLTEIEQATFLNCDRLEEIIIPKSIKTIRAAAFFCESLTKVFYEGDENGLTNIKIDMEYYDEHGQMTVLPPFLDVSQFYGYSKKKPSDNANYWHYVFGKPTVWEN
ncbi:MAG: leucine-rich repeat domain-containing protein [Clostridia bacterium]|nr:leucine-rich repeat domain-containing protein [Clostridia bacterium]